MNMLGNSNIGEQAGMQFEVSAACEQLLEALRIDWRNDPQMRDTPKRMAKMYCQEVFAGRYRKRPDLKAFPNTRQLDQLYTVGPIRIRSACSHHLVPVIGHAWIGLIPGDSVLGLSKFNRLAQWVFARPQIQEEATVQLADEIELALHVEGRPLAAPVGLGVVVRAQHMCVAWRGVQDEGSTMVTSVLRGALRTSAEARAEFFQLIAAQGFQA